MQVSTKSCCTFWDRPSQTCSLTQQVMGSQKTSRSQLAPGTRYHQALVILQDLPINKEKAWVEAIKTQPKSYQMIRYQASPLHQYPQEASLLSIPFSTGVLQSHLVLSTPTLYNKLTQWKIQSQLPLLTAKAQLLPLHETSLLPQFKIILRI